MGSPEEDAIKKANEIINFKRNEDKKPKVVWLASGTVEFVLGLLSSQEDTESEKAPGENIRKILENKFESAYKKEQFPRVIVGGVYLDSREVSFLNAEILESVQPLGEHAQVFPKARGAFLELNSAYTKAGGIPQPEYRRIFDQSSE